MLAAVLALGPAGCGFRPLYGQAGTNAQSSGLRADLSAVRIKPIADREGQMLRNGLLTRLTPQGEPADARYELAVVLMSSESGQGYRKDALATLGQLRVDAIYTLTELNSENPRSFGSRQSTTAYFDYIGPRYATVAMERDAWQRAIDDLADHIANNVSMVLSGKQAWSLKEKLP
ncbi:MAG: LPS assembly lipoprotein LptE [Actinomycetota bacterium]